MDKIDILQDISVNLSQLVKKNLNNIKKLDSQTQKEFGRLLGDFKEGLDDLSEGTNESVNESFEDPLEGFPQVYKDLLKKLQRSNDRGERSMLINKMNVIRKKLKLKPLTSESVNEASRRATDFYGDSKYGKSIDLLLKGKWDSKKVENFLDKLGDGNDVKYARIIDFISGDAGLNIRKYKNIGEQLPDLMKQLEVLYKDFLTESVNEAQKINPTSKKFLKGMKTIKVNGLGGYMPGVDYVYVDGNKYYFVDFEGDYMELKNTDTIKQLHKLHGRMFGESVNEANIAFVNDKLVGDRIQKSGLLPLLGDNNASLNANKVKFTRELGDTLIKLYKKYSSLPIK
jgi:hypothetical protein